MSAYVLRRMLATVPVLFMVSLASFALVRLIPGDPAALLLGPTATQQQIEALREQLGLNKPVPLQYLEYLRGLLAADLGTSLRSGRPIVDELAQRLPATAELTIMAMVLSLPVGILLGVCSAVKRNSIWDHLARLLALMGVSVPVFWLALLAQLIFAAWLDLAPVSGRTEAMTSAHAGTGLLLLTSIVSGDAGLFGDALRHLLLPALVLGAFLAATISRMVRATMLEALGEDYVRTAWAKGLATPRVLGVHALRNALLPVATITGLKFADLLSGAVLTETIFAWPGLGRYMYEAIVGRDYPVVQSTTLLFAVIYIVVLLTVDLAYGIIDPRLRRAGSTPWGVRLRFR